MWSVEVVCVRGAREWASTGRLGEIADAIGMPTHVAHTYLGGDLVVFTGPGARIMHSGHMDADGYQPSPEEHEWLDSLTPEQRKSAMDMLTLRWNTIRQSAKHADQIVDMLLPYARGDAATDNLMSFAMRAEAFRALASGDNELADEQLHTAERYDKAGGPIRVVIAPDDNDDKGNRRSL